MGDKVRRQDEFCFTNHWGFSGIIFYVFFFKRSCSSHRNEGYDMTRYILLSLDCKTHLTVPCTPIKSK